MRKKTNKEFILEVYNLVKEEYVFLEDYITTHQPILVKHNNCGNVYDVSPANFLRGRRCPKCYLESKLKDKHEFEKQFYDVAENEYLLLSEYLGSNAKIRVRHNMCGNEYFVRATSFINEKKKCPHCFGKMLKTNKRFLQEVEKLGKDEYEVLDKYINEKTLVRFKHKECGTIFKITPNHFIWGKRRCPECKVKPIGEKRIEDFLRNNNIEYESQKRFPDCVYKRELIFDFFLKKFNLCIEFDGIQHYFSYSKNEEEFENQKIRDGIKNEYCKVKGINLLRIPYWEINKINEILSKNLSEQKAQKGVKDEKNNNSGKTNTIK